MQIWCATWTGVRQCVSVLVCALSLCACGVIPSIGSDTWKEEVLLHDGQKIIAERTTVRGGRHEIGQRGAYIEQRLRFNEPSTGKTIEWLDSFSEDLGNSSFLPMLLDIVDGTPYLVVSPMGCMAYNKWGRPNPPYVVFKYQGQEWRRITLESLPAQISTPNLIYSSPDDEAKKIGQPVVPAEKIRALYAGYPRPEQKAILREPISTVGANCAEMISNGKGSWAGTGWFRRQPNVTACNSYCSVEKFDEKTCPCSRFFKEE